MKMLNVAAILFTLSGVLAQFSGYSVTFTTTDICAVIGFNVSIPCNYIYPTGQVTSKFWCIYTLKRDKNCVDPPYVYSSKVNTSSEFVYTGNDVSDCGLLIRNVQLNYSGEYKFRFITTKDKFTSGPVNLQVKDLEVSEINLSGNGTLNQGDSVNLTCRLECMESSSEYVWSKDNVHLHSGPVLHLPALTESDSGTYTCTWKSTYSTGSKSIHLQVSGDSELILNLSLLMVALILVVVIIAAVIYMKRKKVEAPNAKSGKGEEKTQVGEDEYTKPQPSREFGKEEEVTYAVVFIQPNKPAKKPVQPKQQEEDDSVIYSAVKLS